MADFDDWNADDGTTGGGATTPINGGLLDPSTFPFRGPGVSMADRPASDSPSSEGDPPSPVIDRSAPELTGPLDTNVHAEVLDDIQKAQAALPPLRAQADAGLGLRHIDPYPGMNYTPPGGYPPLTQQAAADLLNGVPLPKDAFGPHITFSPRIDQPVTDATASMVEKAAVDSGLRSLNISSTTGGDHVPTSRHYDDQAIDVNQINGAHVAPGNPASKTLQDAFARQPNIYENFGPAYQTKTPDGGRPRPARGVGEEHQGHDHFSGWR